MKKLIRVWRLLNQPCDDMIRLVSQSLDRQLSPAERWAIRTHLWYCRACRRYRRQILALREALQGYDQRIQTGDAPSSISLSPAARDRIKSALREND